MRSNMDLRAINILLRKGDFTIDGKDRASRKP